MLQYNIVQVRNVAVKFERGRLEVNDKFLDKRFRIEVNSLVEMNIGQTDQSNLETYYFL